MILALLDDDDNHSQYVSVGRANSKFVWASVSLVPKMQRGHPMDRRNTFDGVAVFTGSFCRFCAPVHRCFHIFFSAGNHAHIANQAVQAWRYPPSFRQLPSPSLRPHHSPKKPRLGLNPVPRKTIVRRSMWLNAAGVRELEKFQWFRVEILGGGFSFRVVLP